VTAQAESSSCWTPEPPRDTAPPARCWPTAAAWSPPTGTPRVRILHGQPADRLLLLAADDSQRNLVLAKAKARFGRVDSVIRPTGPPLVLSA
jgi:hypothetical protein